jgi:hypothetical protein
MRIHYRRSRISSSLSTWYHPHNYRAWSRLYSSCYITILTQLFINVVQQEQNMWSKNPQQSSLCRSAAAGVDGVYAYSYHVRTSSRCDICEIEGSSAARRTGKSVRQCDGQQAATDESRSRASPQLAPPGNISTESSGQRRSAPLLRKMRPSNPNPTKRISIR